MLASTWRNLVFHFVLLTPFTHGFLNLCLTPQEVNRLVDGSGGICYVKNGEVQNYPLGFVMPIAPHICGLNFNWQNLSKKKMSYSITFNFDNRHVLDMFYMNISQQVFRIEDAEVLVTINFNITVRDPDESLNFSLRRNHICDARAPHTISDAYRLLLPSLHELLNMTLFFLFLFGLVFAIIIVAYLLTDETDEMARIRNEAHETICKFLKDWEAIVINNSKTSSHFMHTRHNSEHRPKIYKEYFFAIYAVVQKCRKPRRLGTS
uniref:WIF domain-containing protein n=1 Tax=Tetranychus urticae TaxID=32264 RepID=T1KVG7_TETUR